MKELINANDKYKMNWIEGNTEYSIIKPTVGIMVFIKYVFLATIFIFIWKNF